MSLYRRIMSFLPNISLLKAGLILTALYIFTVVSLFAVLLHFGMLSLAPLQLNELGDTLTGMFGPLAILWLILGFRQQSIELSNSIKTLELQARELALSVEQQKSLVEVNRELLTHEQAFIQAREAARKRSLHPILVFHSKSRDSDDESFFLPICNIGHPVLRPNLERVSSDGIYTHPINQVVDRRFTWERGETINWSLSFDEDKLGVEGQSLRIDDPEKIHLSYYDYDNERHLLIFRARPNPPARRRLVISPIQDPHGIVSVFYG